MNNEFEYRILHKSDSESVVSLCRQENIYLENELIQIIVNCSWDISPNDYIGYGCFDGDKLVGYIGCIQSKRNNYVINDLSCGIVDASYRGKGIASKLFDLAQFDGDIILDLTASEQVYQLFKRKFKRFFDFNDYQLWFNARKLKKRDDVAAYFEYDAYESLLTAEEKKYLLDNSKYSMKFACFKDDDNYCLVSYYTMIKKKLLKGFEVCYISNKSFFEKYYETILKLISIKQSSFFVFLDHRFISNISFDGEIFPRGTNNKEYIRRMSKLLFKKYIKAPNRKFMAMKDGVDKSIIESIDYLYTEMCFYDGLG